MTAIHLGYLQNTHTGQQRSLAQAKNPDLQASMAAMQRAAVSARQIALQTHTAIVTMKSGQMVRLEGEQLQMELAQLTQATAKAVGK